MRSESDPDEIARRLRVRRLGVGVDALSEARSKPWLFGVNDGASIAFEWRSLLDAAASALPDASRPEAPYQP